MGVQPGAWLAGEVNHSAAQSVLIGGWVAADGFERAHDVAQKLEGEWGDWWHAILHRREPDPSNAMYWYRRVKAPAAVWADLGKRAIEMLGLQPPVDLKPLVKALKEAGHWTPEPFVRAVERGQAGKLPADAVAALVALQRLEWRVWLDECCRRALAG
jgi:hypothetical protein